MKLNEENVKFIHTTKIEEKDFSSQNLALAIPGVPVDGPVRKILKHQIKVDNNPR